MAQTYTYDDFTSALAASGTADQWSTADLKLAESNPDFGMTLLQLKTDYAAATTDEERALINTQANELRSSYGNYTGGTDGSGYYLNTISPSSFTYDDAPTYSSTYSDDISSAYDALTNYGTYSYDEEEPEYSSRWQDTIDSLINDILNYEDFSYSTDTDPLYSNYRKQYLREAERATADALGEAAATTGGIASSYATTAAAQAGQYYTAQLADVIPELYELAYNEWLNDYSLLQSDLTTVQTQEDTEYSQYLDELSQYNTNREFDYNAWYDYYNMLNNNLTAAQSLDDTEWEQYLTALSQYNTDRDFYYSQYLDEIESQSDERSEALSNAITAASYGDYSQLQELGINTDSAQYDYALQNAVTAATYGDYSQLAALGVDVSNAEYDYALQNAITAASYGDYSGLAALGIDTSSLTSTGSSYSSGSSSSGSSSSSTATSEELGIVATMQSLGNDTLAYEYLISLGYTNAITANLWELYQEAQSSASSGTNSGAGTATTVSSASDLGTNATNLLNNMTRATSQAGSVAALQEAMEEYIDKIASMAAAGGISEAEADYLLSLLGG